MQRPIMNVIFGKGVEPPTTDDMPIDRPISPIRIRSQTLSKFAITDDQIFFNNITVTEDDFDIPVKSVQVDKQIQDIGPFRTLFKPFMNVITGNKHANRTTSLMNTQSNVVQGILSLFNILSFSRMYQRAIPHNFNSSLVASLLNYYANQGDDLRWKWIKGKSTHFRTAVRNYIATVLVADLTHALRSNPKYIKKMRERPPNAIVLDLNDTATVMAKLFVLVRFLETITLKGDNAADCTGDNLKMCHILENMKDNPYWSSGYILNWMLQDSHFYEFADEIQNTIDTVVQVTNVEWIQINAFNVDIQPMIIK